ncbi:MAG TPA: TonB-dependent receptor [Thermoanaerobaculia bacterium]|jgi:iron complex outermembrane receptor protein/vitamin B12 transporter|nr:TonB-dependent receptor [Thermoanaerobaculia bacterium]
MRRHFGISLAAFALALNLPVAALAQEPATTFYSTATVVERPLSSATGSVTVLDREAIEATGARTMADVLRFLPGLDVTTNGARGGLTTAQIRGGDPNFTLVLLDGVPLNDPTYQVGDVYNLEGLPAAAVERVEVVRGPLSSFYGSTGLAGAVNIVTRQGQDGPPAVELQAMAGDASFRQGQGSVSGSAGKATYYLGGTWEEEEHRVADERFRQSNVQANLALPLGALGKSRFQLKTRWADWRGDDYPDASGGPVYGSGELRRSDHEEASLASELAFGAQKLTLALYRHDRDTDSPAVFPQVPPSVETTRYTVARAGWASTLHDARGVRLSAGVDVQREKGENDSVLLLPPEFGGEVRGDYEITRTLPGAFAELVVDRGAFVFEAGSRFDVPEDGARQWSPRLGVSFRPGNGPTRFHASAGRAWKQPSFFALASPPQLGGNPDLRPEKVLGGDLGVDRHFAAASLDTGLTVFYNRYEDLIDFDFETFTHLNRSEVEAQGVEATLGWTPIESFSLSANTTWQQVEDLTTQSPLRHRPRWVGGLRIDWRPWDRLTLQLDTQATARSFDEQIPVPERDTVPGYAVAGLAGTWRLKGPWEIRGRIDNLTDRQYETLIGFPGPGRSVRIGLRYGGSRR